MANTYTIEQVKKFSPSMLKKIIDRAKKFLKQDKTMKETFDQYGIDVSEIDTIPVMFADLDVSARTNHGIVYLSYKLLCDGDFFKDYAYLVHEFSHYAQQCTGDGPTQGANDGEYLDNPAEVEGFQNQLAWMNDIFGKEHAEKYVDKMLDHHEVKGKEKKEKVKELTQKMDV